MIGAGKGRANALSEVSSKQVFFKSIDELFVNIYEYSGRGGTWMANTDSYNNLII